MKKKIIALCLLAALIPAVLAGCGGNDGETVAVQSVKEIVAGGSLGFVDRYAGLVVSGESAEIKKDPNKTVLEVKVAEGDTVKAGDVLFTYDTQAMELQLEKLQLEYEELQNKITSAQEDIPEIEKKLKYAGATDQLGYKLQIQSLEADILESTYKLSLKEREIAAMQTAMEDTDVVSPISGRVMSVKEEDDSSGDMYGGMGDTSDAFITVTDVGTFRIKGVINEMNVGTMYEGIPVIIRARISPDTTWNGTLEKIDWENTVSNENNYYYGPSDEMTSSTKYPFYITLEDREGLMLGQHVYIEPDYGQNAAADGLWLPEYFIAYNEDGTCFVWAQNAKGRLEKRSVETGESNYENGTVLILSGLEKADFIAMPEESLTAGMTCVPYAETMFGAEEVNVGGVG